MVLKVEGGGLPGFRFQGEKLDFEDSSGRKNGLFPTKMTQENRPVAQIGSRVSSATQTRQKALPSVSGARRVRGGAYRCGTHRVSQRNNYGPWALPWPTDRSEKRCSICYTESE